MLPFEETKKSFTAALTSATLGSFRYCHEFPQSRNTLVNNLIPNAPKSSFIF